MNTTKECKVRKKYLPAVINYSRGECLPANDSVTSLGGSSR